MMFLDPRKESSYVSLLAIGVLIGIAEFVSQIVLAKLGVRQPLFSTLAAVRFGGAVIGTVLFGRAVRPLTHYEGCLGVAEFMGGWVVGPAVAEVIYMLLAGVKP